MNIGTRHLILDIFIAAIMEIEVINIPAIGMVPCYSESDIRYVGKKECKKQETELHTPTIGLRHLAHLGAKNVS